MKTAENRPVALGLRLYRAMARAFPQEFKNAYGTELQQATEDAIEPIWRQHGAAGLVRLLVDVAVRVPAEHLAELRQDVRYGFRKLAGSPGFTAVALLSLSLGIGISTSAFSELNGLALRDTPGVSKPGELVALHPPTSYPHYRRYRELHDLFSSTLAYVAPVPLSVSFGGRTERTWGHLVTGSYFATLGVRPALGRLFAGEEQRGRAPTVVVSHRFWQAQLGGDPTVIGKELRVNGRQCTVVAVGPKGFLGASPVFLLADLWMPITVEPGMAPELAGDALERHDRKILHVLARLRPGVSQARAEAALDAVTRQFEQTLGVIEDRKGRRVRLGQGGKMLPLRKKDIPLFASFFLILAALVLLIACSNVANMMLARALDRRREIAVRLAMGASRARLIRQLLTESMLLAAGAGVLGFFLAMWLMHLGSQVALPYPMPVTYDLTVDGRALWFTLGVTTLTGLAFGLAPALRATRTDLTPALKEGGTVKIRRYRRLSLRNLLVVHQVAGSLALLLLTAFLALGLPRTMSTDVGFDPKGLYLVSLDPVRDGYSGEEAGAFFERVLERVKRLPFVTEACLTDTVPVALSGSPWSAIATPGRDGEDRLSLGAPPQTVGRGYFKTTDIPIRAGRGFAREDEGDDARTVIVSEALAHRLWKGEDPLHRRLEVRSGGPGAVAGFMPGVFDYRSRESTDVYQVIGVAQDVPQGFGMEKSQPAIYFPLRAAAYARPSLRGITLLVRSTPGVDALGKLRQEISAVDANVTPFNTRSLPEQIDQLLIPLHVATWTYITIGAFGLVLALVGVAGVTAYSVSQRGREIGLRIALGARRIDVLGLVIREGLLLVTAGTVIGLAGAWAGVQLLAAVNEKTGQILDDSTSDPVVLVGAPLLFVGLVVLACYLPGRKSLRIEPAAALRQE